MNYFCFPTAIDEAADSDPSDVLFYCRIINDYIERHVDKQSIELRLQDFQKGPEDFKRLIGDNTPDFLVPYEV